MDGSGAAQPGRWVLPAYRMTGAGPAERARAVRRLRGELRRIARRDYFAPPQAVQALAHESAHSPVPEDASVRGPA